MLMRLVQLTSGWEDVSRPLDCEGAELMGELTRNVFIIWYVLGVVKGDRGIEPRKQATFFHSCSPGVSFSLVPIHQDLSSASSMRFSICLRGQDILSNA